MTETPTQLTDEPPTVDDRTASDTHSFEDGRYLYCVVDPSNATPDSFAATGIDDGDPYVIESDGVGVVVQPCDSLFDSADVAEVKQWLLQHQAVVDEAAQVYGTPIPFRFDTILKGDDDAVRDWLATASAVLASELDDLAGKWEFRIEVRLDKATCESELVAADDRLQELQAKMGSAEEGTAFLREKQYVQRVSELASQRLREETDSLLAQLGELSTAVEEVERTTSFRDNERASDEPEYRNSIAVLAEAENEAAIGDLLDDVAAQPAIEIRFTGPWPPYSFAPTLEENL